MFSFGPGSGAAVASEEEGQQLTAAGDAEMRVQALDVLMDGLRADPEPRGGLLLAVAVQQAVEHLPPARRQGTPTRVSSGGHGRSQQGAESPLRPAAEPPGPFRQRGRAEWEIQDDGVAPLPPAEHPLRHNAQVESALPDELVELDRSVPLRVRDDLLAANRL